MKAETEGGSFLDCLNPEQRQAVEHEGSPLLILAGAGSGKTRVITTKIAYLITKKRVDPRSILAVTFTKKAAAEMRERAIALTPLAAGACLRTFHSFGAWFLRVYGAASARGLSENFKVYDDDDSSNLVHGAVPSLDKTSSRSYARRIALAKDYCLSPDDDLTQVASDYDIGEFRTVYKAYQARLKSTGNADFGDLIMLPALMLENNAELAMQMQRRFRVVMVDEYQDSNVAQFRLLHALAGDAKGTYVCVVGDDDQSIYKFRGAEVSNILNFSKVFNNTQTITLGRNYRSTNEILHLASNVVRHNTSRIDKELKAVRGKGERPSLVYLDDESSEAVYCADMIEESVKDIAAAHIVGQNTIQGKAKDSVQSDVQCNALHSVQSGIRGRSVKGCGAHYRDWAILYRSNAQSRSFEVEFMKRKIPYVVVGTLKFYQREEVKDVLAIMSLAANDKDEIAFRRVANKPARGVGAKSLDIVADTAGRLGRGLLETSIEIAASAIDGKRGGTVVGAAGDMPISISKKAAAGLKEFCTAVSAVKKMLHGEAMLSAAVETAATLSGLIEYHTDAEKGDSNSINGTRLANIQELAASAASYDCTMLGLTAFLDDIALSEAASQSNTIIKRQHTALAAGLSNERASESAATEGGIAAREDEADRGAEEEALDAVVLITVHNTKGLEFPRVVLTGVESGLWPHGNEDAEEMEEERRLFYVGVTRAKDFLCVTTCTSRYLYGHRMAMTPSRFIGEADTDGEAFTVIDRRLGNQLPSRFGIQAEGGQAIRLGRNAMMRQRYSANAQSKAAASFVRGTRVYNDDYGYGYVIRRDERNGEVVIIVQFENGGVKRFMPQYQKGALSIVD